MCSRMSNHANRSNRPGECGRQCINRPLPSKRPNYSKVAVCLSVTLVYCGQTVGWIKMKLGMQVGLDPGHVVSEEDPAPHPKKGYSPLFSAHVYCGQTAVWIKMPLGMEVGLSPGHTVRWGPSSPKGHSPQFPPISVVAKWLDGSRCHLVHR